MLYVVGHTANNHITRYVKAVYLGDGLQLLQVSVANTLFRHRLLRKMLFLFIISFGNIIIASFFIHVIKFNYSSESFRVPSKVGSITTRADDFCFYNL